MIHYDENNPPLELEYPLTKKSSIYTDKVIIRVVTDLEGKQHIDVKEVLAFDTRRSKYKVAYSIALLYAVLMAIGGLSFYFGYMIGRYVMAILLGGSLIFFATHVWHFFLLLMTREEFRIVRKK